MELFKWVFGTWEVYKTNMKARPMTTGLATLGAFTAAGLGVFLFSFLSTWGANFAPDNQQASVASSTSITASSTVVSAPINATNVAIDVRAPLTQSSVINNYPKPKFDYSISTSSYDSTTSLWNSEFDVKFIFAPGTVSSIPLKYTSNSTEFTCNNNEFTTQALANGAIQASTLVHCTSTNELIKGNNFVITYSLKY